MWMGVGVSRVLVTFSSLVWMVVHECPLCYNSLRNIFMHVVYTPVQNLKSNAFHLT